MWGLYKRVIKKGGLLKGHCINRVAPLVSVSFKICLSNQVDKVEEVSPMSLIGCVSVLVV